MVATVVVVVVVDHSTSTVPPARRTLFLISPGVSDPDLHSATLTRRSTKDGVAMRVPPSSRSRRQLKPMPKLRPRPRLPMAGVSLPLPTSGLPPQKSPRALLLPKARRPKAVPVVRRRRTTLLHLRSIRSRLRRRRSTSFLSSRVARPTRAMTPSGRTPLSSARRPRRRMPISWARCAPASRSHRVSDSLPLD